MTTAESLAARIAAADEFSDPWPHGIIDDFLPADVFVELVAALPDTTGQRGTVKTQKLPARTLELLQSETVANAIRQRFGFEGSWPHVDAVYRTKGVQTHPDRKDKPWSGVLYLAGDPKGTELYDAAGALRKTIEFIPNRLLCWASRPVNEQHAIPDSKGRWVIQWWFLSKPPGVV